MIDPQKADVVKEYITSKIGSNIKLETGQEVTLLKGDVKVKKDKALLIYRYQLVH